MKLSLVVVNAGRSSGQVIPVTAGQFVIGRDAQCNLRPASALISKRHCAVIVRDGSVFVRDYDSTNGTLVNDVPVKGEVAVRHDDVLKAGPLEFRIAIAADAAKTPLPVKAPAPVEEDLSNEDIAASFMGLDDAASQQTAAELIPDGSTIMDIPLPPGVAPNPADKTEVMNKAALEKKKIDVGSAQNAAAALFAKMNTKRTTR